MRGQGNSELGRRVALASTYGQGVMDAQAADPDRALLRIVFRQHQANLDKIVDAFKEFDGPFNTGHKYARASSTPPPRRRIWTSSTGRAWREPGPCWLNLRNDDCSSSGGATPTTYANFCKTCRAT